MIMDAKWLDEGRPLQERDRPGHGGPVCKSSIA